MVEIRLSTEADLASLAEIYLAARLKFRWEEEPDLLDLFEAVEDETIFVLTEKEVILGFISFFEPTAFIHLLFINSAHQRKGLGQRLIEHTQKYCNRNLQLKCVKENQGAYDFYLKQGWEVLELNLAAEPPYYLMELKK